MNLEEAIAYLRKLAAERPDFRLKVTEGTAYSYSDKAFITRTSVTMDSPVPQRKAEGEQ